MSNLVLSPLFAEESIDVVNEYNQVYLGMLRQVAKSQKGLNKQCGMDGMLGVGDHISHYVLPIVNTF